LGNFKTKKIKAHMSTEKVVENLDSINVYPDILGSYDHKISPLDYLNAEASNQNASALLILNQQINMPYSLFLRVWNSSKLKVCADGGINQLRKYTQLNSGLESLVPDFVIGDLDSATDENLDYYASRGTVKVLQDSQYYTDLTKSVTLINAWFNHHQLIDGLSSMNTVDDLEVHEEKEHGMSTNEKEGVNILVIGGIGGRFDQTMSAINHIWNYTISRPHLKFLIVNPEHTELIILLKPGVNFVNYKRITEEEELEIIGFNPVKSRHRLRNVGVLPLLDKAVITTKGLKWDVENWSTSVKSKMSSSNLQVGEEGFIIKTDEHVFISLEL
jgi:thiamine pyrophosphokinase